MKICSLSDIHGSFIDIPECDVLCIAGDIVDLNNQRSIDASRHWWYNRFTNWVNRLPCKKVIITPGNHDFFLEDAYNKGYYSELKQDLSVRTNSKLVILIDEQYTYKGIKFYGCPWIKSITFQSKRWAFEDDGIKPGETDPDTGEVNNTNEIISHYNKIPNNIDILITHDNPFKNELLENAAKHKIAHLYGHWHDGEDLQEQGYYNCSMLNDNYNHKKEFTPITIDIMDKEEAILSYLDSLKGVLSAFYALKGKDSLTMKELEEFLEMQKDFYKQHTQEEDEIPWNTNLNTEEDELITEDLQ